LLARAAAAIVPAVWRGVALGPRRLPAFRAPSEWPRVSPSIRTVRTVTVAAALAFIVATTFGVSGFVGQRGIAFGATTTLTIIGGDVLVSSDGVSFQAATDGDAVRAGTTIRTSASGYAVITYFDGSTVSVDPATTLRIAVLGADPDGRTTILMRQDLGRTWHSVQKLLSGSSRYEVTTPTMTASVRGTMFAVGVTNDADGQTVSTLDTVEGVVAVFKPGEPVQEVLVRAGFRATATANAPIDTPVPSPEPARTITVSIAADEGVVVDELGRSDGIVDGRVLAQTPGGRIELRGGELVITLPDVSEARVVSVRGQKGRSRSVEVTTTVQEKGGSAQTTTETFLADDASATSVKGTGSEAQKKNDDQGGPGSGPGGFAPNAQPPLLPKNEPSSGASAQSGDKGGGGFVPSAPLPDLPSLTGPASRDPASKPGSDTNPPDTRSGTDPKPGIDHGGGKPDAKGRP